MDDFKAPSAIPNSVVSFVKKIVNKTDPEKSSTSSSYSATAARYRSGSSSRSSYRSPSLSSRRYSSLAGVACAATSSASFSSCSSSSKSDASQAMLNINKLKEKVASHGSRVMASFKTSDPGSGSGSGSSASASTSASSSAANLLKTHQAVGASAASQKHHSQPTLSSSAAEASTTGAGAQSQSQQQLQSQQQRRAVAAVSSLRSSSQSEKSSLINKLSSQSSLTNEQLTAHLTAEERVILEKVFLKLRRLSSRCLAAEVREVASPLESPCSSTSPSCPATSPPLLGFCRICRKNIEQGEKHYFCDTCTQPVCEDCSSYSDKSDGQVWMCSFCRRRGTQPAVVALDVDLGVDFQKRRVSAMASRCELGASRGRGSLESNVSIVSPPPSNASAGLGTSRSSTGCSRAASLFKRRTSISDAQSPRQTSLEVASSFQDHHGQRHASELYLRRARSRPASPERYSAASNHTYDSGTTSASNKYPSSETLSDRRSSSESQGVAASGVQPGDMVERCYRSEQHSPQPRKSYTASDSSLEEFLGDEDLQEICNGSQQKRRRSRRSKILRQKRSLTNEDPDMSIFYQTEDDCEPGARSADGVCRRGTLRLPLSASSGSYANSQLRHIASETTLYLDSGQSGQVRRQSDSQSSDFSDIRLPSPPPDSMSPSSPDYSRCSPRQSADSDMLDLPSIGHMPSARRSIPAVLVDAAVDPNYLSLGDCFGRRSSTGRALPKIPVEQSRSLLDLPGKTNSSTHSLDLPSHDQPRRASAPEGENIRIVIDDVDASGFRNRNSRIERVILHKDENDSNVRTRGFGLCVMGGKMCESDGKLYAFVSWTLPGGSAEKMGLKGGDKILEWDGKSLVNCSYEQVCTIIDCSGKTAELIIEPLNREERKGNFFHQKRRLSQASTQQSFDFCAAAVASAAATSGSPIPVPCSSPLGRRRLPKTPEPSPPVPVAPASQGALLSQISVDPERLELVVTILCARLTTVVGPCYAQVQILPALGFKACKTELSANLEWNETLIFQPFPVDKAIDMAIEVGIWEESGNCLGDTVIPLANTIAHQTDWWPLLPSSYQINRSSSADFKSLLQPTLSLEDNPRLIEHSRSVPSSRRNSGRLDNVATFQQSPLRARNSLESSPTRTQSLRQCGRHSALDIHTMPSAAAELRAPPVMATLDTMAVPGGDMSKLRRKSSSALGTATRLDRTFSLKGSGSQAAAIGSEGISGGGASGMGTGTSSSYPQHANDGSSSSDEAQYSDSDSFSTLAGSFADQGYSESSVVGEIKLGLIMTKGLLEIEVICARGLPLNATGHPPDTYVKTYMRKSHAKELRNPKLHKRKTAVVLGTCSPQYRQTLTYDAQCVQNKKLLVMVWEKHKRFDHNNLIGGVDVEVMQLPMHKLTIGWYKLFRAAKYNP